MTPKEQVLVAEVRKIGLATARDIADARGLGVRARAGIGKALYRLHIAGVLIQDGARKGRLAYRVAE